jgi:hypothetical protein
MNAIAERWIGSCRELLDRTLVWNQRHLMTVLREYEDFCNTRRPHRALNQAAPLRPLPDGVTNLDQLRVQRRDRASTHSTGSPSRARRGPGTSARRPPKGRRRPSAGGAGWAGGDQPGPSARGCGAGGPPGGPPQGARARPRR